MNDKWIERFLALAEHVAQWSKDPSTKTGAVIVRPDKTIAGIGYNGFPRGLSDAPALYADREIKYGRVIHCEINAIYNSRGSVEGCTAFLTCPPCERCAAHLIQYGIAAVYCREPTPEQYIRWQISRSEDMLREAGVMLVYY